MKRVIILEDLKMSSEMSFEEVFSLLEAWGTESRRKANAKKNAGENQFGVAIGNLKTLAKKLEINHSLAMELWKSENVDARLLATMIMDENELDSKEIMEMLESLNYLVLIDEFVNNVIVKTSYFDKLHIELINSDKESCIRAGWNIIILKIINQNTLDIDFDSILKIIENNLKDSPRGIQESMNRCLCEIGIHFPKYTEKCIDIGERLGRLDNRQIPKGATSTYAPEWITTVISRNNKYI